MHLNLQKKCNDAAGISNLLQGKWPVLLLLQLSVQGRDNKAYSLLHMTDRDKSSVLASSVSYHAIPK